MTTTMIAGAGAGAGPVTSVGPAKALRHGLLLAGRNLRKTLKSPEQLVEATLMPVIMLLMFVYLFGGAIGGGDRDAYLQHLLPGLMAQTILFATLGTGVGLCTDITKGVFDRFRSLPIARSAPLFGAVLGDAIRYIASSVFLLAFGMILGFDITTGALSAALAVIMAVLFGLCLCWISAWVGMLVKSPQAVPGVMVAFIMPLGFVSNVFVQTNTLPDWLKAFADIQPVSLLAEVNRGLLTGGPVGGPLLGTLAWMAGFVAVFYPLAMVTYRRRVA